MSLKPLTLHVEIPFCPEKCGFCDRFVLSRVSVPRREEYLHALYREIESVGEEMSDYEVSSLSLGGGRVSDLGGLLVKELLDVLFSAFRIRENAEIVLETAPSGISAAFLDKLKGFPQLRFHLEQGTFDPFLHLSLKQNFPLGAAEEAMEVLQGMHRSDLTLSLLYGMQGEGVPSLRASLGAALALGASSVSLRPLRLTKGTCVRDEWEIREKRRIAAKAPEGKASSPYAFSPRYQFPDADTRIALKKEGAAFLLAHGMKQQTWSFFAKKGFESRLISDHADAVEELGLGLGAVSHFDGISFRNTQDLSLYLSHSADYELILAESRADTPEEIARRALFRQLSRPEGIDKSVFLERFGMLPEEACLPFFELAGRKNWIIHTDKKISLTEEGAFFYEADALAVPGRPLGISAIPPQPDGRRDVRRLNAADWI